MPTIASSPLSVIVSRRHFAEPNGGFLSPGFTVANGLHPHLVNGVCFVLHMLVTGGISDLMSNPQ
ncbi:hypothetical protein [Rhodanobacter soli]|jgi:hypothetical protein|nr:hypothetical protein [Rhodanobacter denitrificans]